MKLALNFLSVLVASVIHLISGFNIISMSRVHMRQFSEMDLALPVITQAVVSYASTAMPAIVGLVLCVVTLVGLGLVIRIERSRWLLPIGLCVSFTAAFVHIMFVVFGMTLPWIRYTAEMG